MTSSRLVCTTSDSKANKALGAQGAEAAQAVERRLRDFEWRANRLVKQAAPPGVAGLHLVSGKPHQLADLIGPGKLARSIGGQTAKNDKSGPHGNRNRHVNGEISSMNATLGPTQEISLPVTGSIFVALKFVPESGSATLTRCNMRTEGDLYIQIKEARNIGGFASNQANRKRQETLSGQKVPPSSGGLPKAYCKCYLLDSNGQRVAKEKTSVHKRSANPRWPDEQCIFRSLRMANLIAQGVEVHLLNRDSILVSGESLGAIRLCKQLPSSATAAATVTTTTTTTTTTAEDGPLVATNQQRQLADDRSETSADTGAGSTSDSLDGGGETLCNERESRIWTQMLARPNMWIYGELPLRQLRPLVALNLDQSQQGIQEPYSYS